MLRLEDVGGVVRSKLLPITSSDTFCHLPIFSQCPWSLGGLLSPEKIGQKNLSNTWEIRLDYSFSMWFGFRLQCVWGGGGEGRQVATAQHPALERS